MRAGNRDVIYGNARLKGDVSVARPREYPVILAYPDAAEPSRPVAQTPTPGPRFADHGLIMSARLC